MAIGTSDGEHYPSQLEEVLAALDTSGKETPTRPRNAPSDANRDINDMNFFRDDKGLPIVPGSGGFNYNTGEEIKRVQAGPNNKDTTPVPDNLPDLYEDSGGRQRSRKNDAELEQFNSFTDKFAKGLTEKQVELLKYWYRGEYSGSKPTDAELEDIKPLRDAVEEQTKHMPSSRSRFEGRQEYIDMYNWGGLLMDKVLKHYDTINPGRRTENESLPENARPTQAEIPPPERNALAKKLGFTEENYNKLVEFLDDASNMKGAENWSAKELLGFMISQGQNALGFNKAPTGRSGPARDLQMSGKDIGISNAKKPSDFRVSNDNYPDTPEFSNLRMSAQEMKEYLADRSQRPDTSNMSLAEIEKMTSQWEKDAAPTAYDRAVERQKAGRTSPTGDTADEFIKEMNAHLDDVRKGLAGRQDRIDALARGLMEKDRADMLSNSTKPGLQVIEGGRSTKDSYWSMHSEKVHNLHNAEGVEIGSVVFREHNGKWVGSRFNPEDNQIVGRKTFDTLEDASAYVEGRLSTENPSQQPQGRFKPTQEQIDTQAAQQKVNVGRNKGVLNDNMSTVAAMVDKGMTPSEIAKRFDITPLAVRNWIKRKGGIDNITNVLRKIEENKNNP